jgi:hypothetical protein
MSDCLLGCPCGECHLWVARSKGAALFMRAKLREARREHLDPRFGMRALPSKAIEDRYRIEHINELRDVSQIRKNNNH